MEREELPQADAPDLSLVIPFYNCRSRVGPTVEALTSHLDGMALTWEAVLVDDGSTDGTAEALRGRGDDDQVAVVHLARNRGKGGAVAAGMARARGRCRIFTDADLPYRLDAVGACCRAVLDRGYHAAFGNRLLDGSVTHGVATGRRWASRLVRLVAGTVIGRRDVDTQCGLKAFSAELADALFPMLRIDGFLFDVELTLLLSRAGVPMGFVPVTLVNQDESTVRVLRTGFGTLRDAWRIWRGVAGRSYDVS